MSWFNKTFSTSIGRKLLMALAGLFLIVYLVIHLGINFLIVLFDDPETFNKAAHFMGTNWVIRIFEVILFLGFIIHIVYGLIISYRNKKARPVGYKIKKNSSSEAFSNFMTHTGIIVFIFLIIHMADFYVKLKITGDVDTIIYDGETYHNLGALVIEKFKMTGYVIFYVIALLLLGFHLKHGFYSAFQTLGWTHKKYTPFIKGVSVVYTLVITLGFIAIPVFVYFFK